MRKKSWKWKSRKVEGRSLQRSIEEGSFARVDVEAQLEVLDVWHPHSASRGPCLGLRGGCSSLLRLLRELRRTHDACPRGRQNLGVRR